jgi:hypothetical protein
MGEPKPIGPQGLIGSLGSAGAGVDRERMERRG